MSEFDHIPEPYRAKVAQNLLAHTTLGKQWDWEKFNPLNDYQRHLYALFLRLAGMPFVEVWAKIYTLAEDVSPPQRQRYTDEVLHSAIVGYPQEDGSLIAIPEQKVEA